MYKVLKFISDMKVRRLSDWEIKIETFVSKNM